MVKWKPMDRSPGFGSPRWTSEEVSTSFFSDFSRLSVYIWGWSLPTFSLLICIHISKKKKHSTFYKIDLYLSNIMENISFWQMFSMMQEIDAVCWCAWCLYHHCLIEASFHCMKMWHVPVSTFYLINLLLWPCLISLFRFVTHRERVFSNWWSP